MKICVYCASSAAIDAVYFEAAKALATELVKNNVEVVYGGGAVGLMGMLADTILAKGGGITGIIPRFMFDLGWAHTKVTDLIITETMHQRKARYLENIDGVVALPGGCGTLEELLEVITLKKLGQFSKPIAILNTHGFYEPLKSMLSSCINEKFMQASDHELWKFIDNPLDVMEYLKKVKK